MTPCPPSRSEFVRAHGLRHHIRRWGEADRPLVVLLHGWLDLSETFAPLVAPLLDRWQVMAPDFRGFGYSEWAADGYWFPDYVADLDAILAHYRLESPVAMVGHSMGAQVASLFAGLRPDRVSRLVTLDGLYLPDMPPDLAPKRLRKWLDALDDPPRQKTYASFDDLARRVQHQHPRLPADRALYIARCWGHEDGHGRITLNADPRHRMRSAMLYRAAESMAVWRDITARTLFVDGAESAFRQSIPAEEATARRACFRDHCAVTIPEAGHMLHFDAPEATAKAIAEFLDAEN